MSRNGYELFSVPPYCLDAQHSRRPLRSCLRSSTAGRPSAGSTRRTPWFGARRSLISASGAGLASRGSHLHGVAWRRLGDLEPIAGLIALSLVALAIAVSFDQVRTRFFTIMAIAALLFFDGRKQCAARCRLRVHPIPG